MKQNLDETILILNLVVFGVITLFLWCRLFLPESYIIGSIFLGILVAISWTANRSKSYHRFLQIFCMFFFILNVFYIGTHYKILPFSDSYVDYAVTRIFDQNAKVFVVPFFQLPDLLNRISLSSGWPLIQSLSIMFSKMTGIPLFQTCLIIPIITSSLSFVFVYLILKKVQKALNLEDTGILFGLLVFISWPNLIYWSLQYGHMNTGLMFFTILIYSVLRFQSGNTPGRDVGLAILFSVSLVLTHSLSSFIFVIYLFLMAFIITTGHYSRRISSMFSQSLNSMWSLTVTALALLILWWNSYAPNIWSVLEIALKDFIGVLYHHAQNPLLNTAPYPSSLTPFLTITLNYCRAISVLGLAFLGFFMLLKRRARMGYAPQISFLLCTGLAFGILLVFSFLSIASNASRLVTFNWSRIITYAMPLICICAAFFVEHYVKKFEKSRILVPLFAFLLVVSSLTGLWGINFAPAHIYNPSLSPEVGEHNTNFVPVELFLNNYVSFDNISSISSDDPSLLLVIIPTSAYEKMTMLNPSDFNPKSQVVVEFNGFNLYNYFNPYWEATVPSKDIELVATQLSGALENQSNRVYDNSISTIWWP